MLSCIGCSSCVDICVLCFHLKGRTQFWYWVSAVLIQQTSQLKLVTDIGVTAENFAFR